MASKSPSPRPLSIKVIAALYFAIGLFLILVIMFDVVFHRTPLPISFFLLSLFFIMLGVGLWLLSNFFRIVAILFNASIMIGSVYYMIRFLLTLPPTAILDAASALVSSLILWFLIKRKSAFVKLTTTP